MLKKLKEKERFSSEYAFSRKKKHPAYKRSQFRVRKEDYYGYIS